MSYGKIAIVGLGYWGPNLVRNFLKFVDKKNIVLCDINAGNIKKVSSKYDITNYETDYDNILKNKDINSVVICTPAETHFNLVKLALLYNKNVLVEKPMTITYQESQELIQISVDKNLILMTDLTYLYNPAVLKIKDLTEAPEFGKVKCINSTRINLGIFRKDVDVLWDLACHDISILNFILGSNPIYVSSFGKNHTGTGKIDTAFINLEYENSVMANVFVSWISPVKIRQMLFTGEKQSIMWDDVKIDEKIKIYNKQIVLSEGNVVCLVGDSDILKVDGEEALQSLSKDFIERASRNKKNDVNMQRSLDIIKVLEAIGESVIHNGMVIRI